MSPKKALDSTPVRAAMRGVTCEKMIHITSVPLLTWTKQFSPKATAKRLILPGEFSVIIANFAARYHASLSRVEKAGCHASPERSQARRNAIRRFLLRTGRGLQSLPRAVEKRSRYCARALSRFGSGH